MIKICLACKKEFEVHPYRKDTAKYCSCRCSAIGTKNGFQKGHSGYTPKLSEKHKKKIGLANSIALMGRKGEKSSNWKGGKIKGWGYWFVYKPNHFKAFLNKTYVKQAVLVAEKCLKRLLTKEEIVHHIGRKDDDRPKMLYLFSNRNEHDRYEGLKNKPKLVSNL